VTSPLPAAQVLGSQPEAEKGSLLVMVGCESEDALQASRVLPVLRVLSSEPIRVGEVRCWPLPRGLA
jgi:3-hydroxyisobutyrate dehydrogenase-like beta-hydroxyacid dehydrogenase